MTTEAAAKHECGGTLVMRDMSPNITWIVCPACNALVEKIDSRPRQA